MILATWNVNSVRVRTERLVRWLGSRQPDVVCLQELKCMDEEFPLEAVQSIGYHVETHGQKSYNGVAILSRTPMTNVTRGFGQKDLDQESRLIAATIEGVRVICAYVPAGGEDKNSPKYSLKIKWLRGLLGHLKDAAPAAEPIVVCGDFNIAPSEKDISVLDRWRDSAVYNEELTDIYNEFLALGFCDNFRQHNTEGGLYTWWDYNDLCYHRNEGLRIDHILSPQKLEDRCYRCWVDWEERRGAKASDHAPMLADFDWAGVRQRDASVAGGQGHAGILNQSFIAPADVQFGESAGCDFVRSLFPDLAPAHIERVRIRFPSGYEETLRWNYFPAGAREWTYEGADRWFQTSLSTS